MASASLLLPPRTMAPTRTLGVVHATPVTVAKSAAVKIDVSHAPERFSRMWGGPPGFDTRPLTPPRASWDAESDDGGSSEPGSPPTRAVAAEPAASAASVIRIELPAPSRAKLERLRDGKCGGNSCHQCKSTKDAVHLFVCYNNIQGLGPAEAKRRAKARHKACRKKYCARCLIKFYRINPSHVREPLWTCPGCQGFCSCASCRKRRMRQGLTTRPIVRPGSPVPADDAEMLTSHGADRDFAIAVAAAPAGPTAEETTVGAASPPLVASLEAQKTLTPLPPCAPLTPPSLLSKTSTTLQPLPDFSLLDQEPATASPFPGKSWGACSGPPPRRGLDEFFALPPAAAASAAIVPAASLVPPPLPFHLEADEALGPVVTGSTVLHALAGQEPVRRHIHEIVNEPNVDEAAKVDEIASFLQDIASDPRFCDALEEADFYLS